MPHYPGVRKLGKRWFYRIQHKNRREQHGPFDTAQEAHQNRIDYLKKLKHQHTKPGNITVAQLCVKYLEEHEKVYNKHSTLRKSEGICRNHIIPILGKRRLDDLNPNEMRIFQKHCIQTKTQAVAHNTMIVLKKILNWAVEWELLPSNPIKGRIPPAPVTRHPTIDPEQLKYIMQSIPIREKVVIGLGLFAGLRIGEIFGLAWSDINFQDSTIHLQRQYSSGILSSLKTESSESIIPLWDPLASLLKIWRLQCGSTMWLFKGRTPDFPLRPECWRQLQWSRIKKQFNLPPDLRFHDMRHSFATILLSLGADKGDIQQLMRHKSIKITMDIYRHMLPRHLIRALKFFNELDVKKLENNEDMEG